jgi:hypothetical protein
LLLHGFLFFLDKDVALQFFHHILLHELIDLAEDQSVLPHGVDLGDPMLETRSPESLLVFQCNLLALFLEAELLKESLHRSLLQMLSPKLLDLLVQ